MSNWISQHLEDIYSFFQYFFGFGALYIPTIHKTTKEHKEGMSKWKPRPTEWGIVFIIFAVLSFVCTYLKGTIEGNVRDTQYKTITLQGDSIKQMVNELRNGQSTTSKQIIGLDSLERAKRQGEGAANKIPHLMADFTKTPTLNIYEGRLTDSIVLYYYVENITDNIAIATKEQAILMEDNDSLSGIEITGKGNKLIITKSISASLGFSSKGKDYHRIISKKPFIGYVYIKIEFTNTANINQNPFDDILKFNYSNGKFEFIPVYETDIEKVKDFIKSKKYKIVTLKQHIYVFTAHKGKQSMKS